ncbi:flagellar basal body rod protein FlgG [Shouchella shacheensis]|uniref:flagellar basal body rod protein FlgG n=1 Tax=Shouchella shacheensis TaxID=1649580 RepID=UPI0007401273|nr:flagellar basal body rod protein FlgG [Shouchella shacheensis]
MIRSMYSGISGMKNFQTKLDVTGNNIANVNTHGFKKSRTTFQDMVSQQLQGATAATADRGSTNAKQVGSGSQVGSIDTVHESGGTQFTGRTLDLTLNGDGYFMVNNGGATSYTRAGNFYLDNNGDLVTSSGAYVLDSNENTINFGDLAGDFDAIADMSIGKDGSVVLTDENGDTLSADVQIGVARFTNPEGLASAGGSLFTQTTASGALTITTAGEAGTGEMESGFLEMSNVDLSDEFTEMIVAQRGFQANSRVITTSDEILQELVNLKR